MQHISLIRYKSTSDERRIFKLRTIGDMGNIKPCPKNGVYYASRSKVIVENINLNKLHAFTCMANDGETFGYMTMSGWLYTVPFD